MHNFNISIELESQDPDFNDFFDRIKRKYLGSVITPTTKDEILNQIDIYFDEMIGDGYIHRSLGRSLAEWLKHNLIIS